MATTSNIAPKPLVDASEITTQAVKPPVKRFDKKPILIVVAVVLLLTAIIFGIYYFFIYRDNVDQTEDVNASVFTPEDDEIDYFNEKYNFKMIIKKDWNINEFGTKVEFNVGSDGKIYFEAFEDSEFANISEIDERFCQSFEEGFKEGLEGNELANNFDFKLFEQNGLNGCSAEGEILEGFRQKYNVFYNPELKLVYSIFYTSANLENEAILTESIASFRLAD
jgi:hypothetical protein